MKNIFRDIPHKLPQEFFETLLLQPQFKLERIVSQGHITPPEQWYDQEDDEWVVLLKGNATLRFEDDEKLHPLQPGDSLYIPAHRRHRVESTSTDPPAIWLALHFTPNTPKQ